jgi:hypothetical protein
MSPLTSLLPALDGRVFVDHAARETLSATLTPSTAAGGAEGDRCTGWPAVMAAATSTPSDPMQPVQLPLKGGDARGALGHWPADEVIQ